MKILSKKDLKNLIRGASLLSTGGGGSVESAEKVLLQIRKLVKLGSTNEFLPADLCVTIFGVGGKESCDPVKAAKLAMHIFQKVFWRKIKAIIPVEIGPLATISAVFVASGLDLPIVDADIVGFRSSPEVFLETISIADLSRTPMVAVNQFDEVILLDKVADIGRIEKLLRNFAVISGGDAFVVGYPLKIKQIKGVVGKGSISFAIKVGRELESLKKGKLKFAKFCRKNGLLFVGKGKIIKEQKGIKKGFTMGKYIIKTKKGEEIEVFFKNENIVVLINEKVQITTPDLVCLLDIENYLGLNNFSKNKGKNIAVLAKKAIPIWQTEKGRQLFSPRNLGLPFEQKLL